VLITVPGEFRDSPTPSSRSADRKLWRRTLLFGLSLFLVLSALSIVARQFYVLTEDDVPIFADSLLLAPDARWQDWFTRGHSDYNDIYPDWPGDGKGTAFARPAFHFIIYIASFILGKDWPSYIFVNALASALLGALAFQIAQHVLALRTVPACLAALLVVLSPPVLGTSLKGVGYANEPLAGVFVAGAFLAVFARRDLVCLALLSLALMTKENAVWAPIAAAVTLALRPRCNEPSSRRAFLALTMLLPLVLWLVLRFSLFDGLGGTYATRYGSLTSFLASITHKLTHPNYIFIIHQQAPRSVLDRGAALLILDRATALLFYGLLLLYAFGLIAEVARFAKATRRTAKVILPPELLVALWAALPFGFYLALPMTEDRYAASVVIFAWPALVAEINRRFGIRATSVAFSFCVVLSLVRLSYFFVGSITDPALLQARENFKAMNTVISTTPENIREIYVISAGSLLDANPKYLRLSLRGSAEIVRLVDIIWQCRHETASVKFEHSIRNGVVSVKVGLPDCAHFRFLQDRFHAHIKNGWLIRSDSLIYELPEAKSIDDNLGRNIAVHVKPGGPARFVIEHGAPNGIGLFDVESRSRKSAQDDKWSFCLTAGTLCPSNQERP